jgi:methyl acetate hydrolase
MATDRDRNIFEGVAGLRRLGSEGAMTTDTVFAIFSTTKAITGTAALQLVEEGKLDLDAPAKNYAHDIGRLQVIEGIGSDGEPKLRPPKRDITTRMLLLHTAGLDYDFFNETYNRLAQEKGQPSVVTSSKAALMTPLPFDPGDRWECGSNMDWCGQVVEGITGKRLGEVFRTRIFEPLGMNDTAFAMNDSMRRRVAGPHRFYRSQTRPRSAATSNSKRRSTTRYATSDRARRPETLAPPPPQPPPPTQVSAVLGVHTSRPV